MNHHLPGLRVSSLRMALLGLSCLLCAQGAPGQLSTSDWMTAGAYGNLFLLDGEAIPAEEQSNAALFATLWQQATGQEIMRGAEMAPGFINVALGKEHLNEDMVLQEDMAALGADGYFLNTYSPSKRYEPLGASKQLVIAGNSALSTRMGIYGFFRRQLDCEFLAPGISDIRRAGFRFGKRRELVKPGFLFREVGYPPSESPEEAEFRIANGLQPAVLTPQMGRDSSYALLPPEKYFDAHPEYYAEIAGKRTALKDAWRDASAAQLREAEFGEICPSAPGLAEALVASIVEAIEADEKNAPADDENEKERKLRAGWLASRRVWAITPMRGAKACECAACAAKSEEEGGPMGPWLALVNAIGEGLEAARPGKGYRVLTHADGARAQPPRALHAGPNVIVMLSTDACDFSTPIGAADTPENKQFGEALAAWSRCAGHVWVADTLGSMHADATPFPVLPVLQENLRFYAQHNVEGVYYQSRGPRESNDDFSALKYFIAARLLFDPDADVDYLTERFLEAFYGDAATEVAAYLREMKPLKGLMPTSSAQAPLLEARAAAQAKLGATIDSLPAGFAARVRALLP